jgi:hypothetical protein
VLTADFLTSEDKLWLLQQLQTCIAGPVDAAVVLTDSDAAAGVQHTEQPESCMHGSGFPALGGASASAGGCADERTGQQDHWFTGQAGTDSPSRRVLSSHSRSLSAQQLPGQVQQHQQGVVVQEAEVPLQLQQHDRSQQLSTHVDEPLSAKQQLLSTFRNKLIWYLMLLKALKVGCNSAASAAAGV